MPAKTSKPESFSDEEQEAQTLVTINGVVKQYGDNTILNGIDYEVKQGDVVVVIGPSGGGKSTLLRCLNGLEPIQGGNIEFKDKKLGDWNGDHLRQQIGMVFQQFNLFPHLSILDNLTLAPRRIRKEHKGSAESRAMELLGKVGLSDKSGSYPSELSGGQQQRAAIARALMMDPDLMLFDEVTSALDPELVGEVLTVMRRLADRGMTMVVVTHEIDFARDVGDDLLFIADGKIVESGNPQQVLEDPQQERTQRFLQRTLNRGQ